MRKTIAELPKRGIYLAQTVFLLATVLTIGGCANITVQPLKADGTPDNKAGQGIRYYMPKPYLLVMELPPVLVAQDNPQDNEDNNAPAVESTNTDQKSSGGKTSDTSPSNQVPAAVASASGGAADVSFTATTPNYVVRLIYLPDLQHPMAIQQNSGLTGTSTLSPSLQDGWMLTSLNGSADTKAAETLSSLASVISSLGTAVPKIPFVQPVNPSKTSPKESAQDLSKLYKKNKGILHPGLYAFDYDGQGQLTGLKLITKFTGDMDK